MLEEKKKISKLILKWMNAVLFCFSFHLVKSGYIEDYQLNFSISYSSLTWDKNRLNLVGTRVVLANIIFGIFNLDI